MAVGALRNDPLTNGSVPALCRDCASLLPRGAPVAHCLSCGSRRIVAHPDLERLSIVHVDCDAFFASVEKHRRPELAGKPLLVGGTGDRGVVSTACYIARLSGARSAMPMRQARQLCPDAIVLEPDISAYRAVAKTMREMMSALTPLVEARSIDEAVLDLSGTMQLHGAPPCVVAARLALAVERELGVSISVGLAENPMMAKLAAEIDKPRGYGVIGAEAPQWLAPRSVRTLPGVGTAQERALGRAGFTTLGAIAALSNHDAARRLGPQGPSLAARARGEDARRVTPSRPAKSVSVETTFATDISDVAELERRLWLLCERLGSRLRKGELAATGVSLKLRTSRFETRTRAAQLFTPTILPERLFTLARDLLTKEIDGSAYRLLGIGTNGLAPLGAADPPDLADPNSGRRAAVQNAIDSIRTRFGDTMLNRGRALDRK
ncbi:DNA polymerase IV [Acetobacter nitrogenifigens DSM 23921 = NBRC 105050]|uniref:DNA polymerase IV n=1 Tax=Acetobacter nitrogenifigens DSM 23921 = NBRC 105050 TaxID=1120919 RepID=A0A511XC37_9PROT|nr:DNA polymerase IV [Acetobacter nitrogenifigens]GBQ94231.1 DNA polymerase IV [Acetobacter nitrogenifigens DSM 23921 = NBRC 105050]GEN60526.1 DNA polymerase IV [Acetobacter nitrogenifigens DSM 23921 = NBRC 105050]